MHMDLFSIILIVLGLVLFEIIISVDNAIINAQVLHTMSKRARRWFLIWGILIAVFLVRGLLPLIILWVNNPSLGLVGAFTASFSSNPEVARIIEESAPVLLIGGGIFLIFLFFHWLFLEPKHYGLIGERFIEKQGVWFYAIVSILLTAIVWFAMDKNPLMALSAVIGAFAFTLSIPLILIGNGIGALVVRQLTISNIENVVKYKYLKNGAMYSIFVLGLIMVADSFGMHIPAWLSPIITFSIIGFFFYKSVREIKK